MTCDSTCCQNVPALTGNEMYKLWQSIIYILSGCYDCRNGFDDYKLVLIGFIAGFFILLFKSLMPVRSLPARNADDAWAGAKGDMRGDMVHGAVDEVMTCRPWRPAS
jgi:hypothetical protein